MLCTESYVLRIIPCSTPLGLCRRARQQEEWEARQEERKARQAEMAGEPFDKEVGSPVTLHLHLTCLNCGLFVIQLPHVQAWL